MSASKTIFDSQRHQNDLAVDLLKRHCYRHSFATFQRALNATISHVGQEDGQSPCSPRSRNTSVDSACVPYPFPPKVNCRDLLLVDLQSADQVLELLQGNDDEEVCLVVLLGNYMESLPDSSIAKNITNAVIMLNMGVARQTYAKALYHQLHPEGSRVQLEEAARFFEASVTTLKRIKAPTYILEYKVLILQMVVLLALHSQAPSGKVSRKLEKKLSRVHTKIWRTYRLLQAAKNSSGHTEVSKMDVCQSRSVSKQREAPERQERGLFNPAA